MKSIYVTGANGWLGKGLIQSLVQGDSEAGLAPLVVQQGENLKCFIRKGDDITALRSLVPRAQFFEGDLTKPQDCSEFFKSDKESLLFHTAGIIHPRRISEFYEINLQGTKNVLNAAVANRFQRAVIVSSNSPLGNNPHRDHQFDEKSNYNPYMNYGRSKMMMEKSVVETLTPSETEFTLIRAPWFYGPHQPPRQSLFFSMIRQGKFPLLGDGKNKRSMAYISNLAQGLIRSATHPAAKNEIFWIADERPYTMLEIVTTIQDLFENDFGMKCRRSTLHLPNFVGDIAECVDWSLQAVGLYHQKFHVLSEMNKTIACSIEKSKRVLGYQPKVELKEGMRRSMKWCLDQGLQL